jgi:hypothetical protein
VLWSNRPAEINAIVDPIINAAEGRSRKVLGLLR